MWSLVKMVYESEVGGSQTLSVYGGRNVNGGPEGAEGDWGIAGRSTGGREKFRGRHNLYQLPLPRRERVECLCLNGLGSFRWQISTNLGTLL